MTKEEIFAHVDHTLLSVTATEADIRATVREGVAYGCASVCIPPRFVRAAAEEADGRIAICTVIGFPNGYTSPEAKVAEAKAAIRDGATELDAVIPVGALRARQLDDIREELFLLREATQGCILKVIIETCLLTDEEKRLMCNVVSASGADFIKTSTGFSTEGATDADVMLLAKYAKNGLRVKAAGGIRNFDDAARFLALGADRLGTSRLVKLMQNEEAKGY